MWLSCVPFLTFWTWFLCVTDTQRSRLGLFSVSVMPLWCIHVLMINWEINKHSQTTPHHLFPPTKALTVKRLERLTAVVLDIVDSDVGWYKWRAVVFLLVPLFCQKLGFGLLCLDNILYLCTRKQVTETKLHPICLPITALPQYRMSLSSRLDHFETFQYALNAKINFRNPTQHLIG